MMWNEIACRRCDEPNCNRCNLYTLEQMLYNGAFDSLCDGHKYIVPTNNVRPVVHGMWVRDEYGVIRCSVCNAYLKDEEYENHTFKKCYYCGADMRLLEE